MKAMIKVLIVDDEPPARDLLASMLSCHDSIQIIGMVGNVPEARAFLQQETPDVVFLDIEMPGAPGLDLQYDLPPGTLTIFVTAFADYALQAFDFGARGYLLKPLDATRLALVLERLWLAPVGLEAPDDVAEDIECVVEEGRMVLVSPERILWIEACQNYTMLRLVDGGPLLMLARNMTEWERLLSRQGFERLSRSMIINLRRIQTVCWESRDATVVDFVGCTHQLRLGRTAALRLKARLKNSLSQ
jgi:two-component system LytT family response regulator